MSKIKFNNELAAHNVATILTQATIGEIDKEQIPLLHIYNQNHVSLISNLSYAWHTHY